MRDTTPSTGPRAYHCPGGNYRSITSKLSATADMSWYPRWVAKVGQAEADRISFVGRDRGSMVHRYTECWYQLERGPEDHVAAQAFGAAKIALHDTYGDDGLAMARTLVAAVEVGCPSSDLWCQEMPLWIDELRTAGRVDHIGLWYGVPSVIDYKTSKKPKSEDQIEDYFLQCTFYALAHNALFGTDIQQFVVLITCLTGELQTFVRSVATYEQALRDRLALYDEIQADTYMAA